MLFEECGANTGNGLSSELTLWSRSTLAPLLFPREGDRGDEFLKERCTVNISKLEHIGIAVKDLDAAVAFYEKTLGLRCYAIEEVADQKVRTAFFYVGTTKIELLASTAPDGPVARFIEKRGEGIHHLAFAVDDVKRALDDAGRAGVQLIDQEPRVGAEGLQIAFAHPRSTFGVLTEFCSPPSS